MADEEEPGKIRDRIDVDDGWLRVGCRRTVAATRRLTVERSAAHGLFRYVLERHFGPAEDDEGVWADGFWQAETVSGLFDTLEGALNEGALVSPDNFGLA